MRLDRLWLTDFRNYAAAQLVPAPVGLTAIVGGNGEGKTNLLEAVGYLATLSSFRGAPPEALIRAGAGSAVVRAEGERDDRSLLLEAELRPSGRDRVLVNRQPLRRSRDLLGALRVSVFSPDDLVYVKGGPAERRRWLDDTLVATLPRCDALRSDLERILRQRNSLLKQAGGRLGPDVATTLDVWDAKLAETGEALARERGKMAARVEPEVGKAYQRVADQGGDVTVSYRPSWPGPLLAALTAARPDDLRRGVTTVGPHRDEVVLTIGGMPARTHGSQGEQRSLALALRLAAHAVVTASVGESPVLLLDDVFSELDETRASALVAHLPSRQALLTTAGPLPAGAAPAVTVRVRDGRIEP